MLYTLCKDCGSKISYKTTRCIECDNKFKKESSKRNNMNRYIRDKSNQSYRLFYSSTQWISKREEILRRDNNECQVCKAMYKFVQATDVHHILNLKDNYELRLDNNNLISLCKECHKDIHRLNINNKDKLNKYINQKINSDKFIKKLLRIEN